MLGLSDLPLPTPPRILWPFGAKDEAPRCAPEPPIALPKGCLVHVPGRGELFVRDSGPEDADPSLPPVLLLHGWMFGADLNWLTVYGPLRKAGHRVLAVDHRGHGRGLRSPKPFRLEDCAHDAIELLRVLEVERAVVVGYSMGGAIAWLMARDAPELIQGVVACATSHSWQDPGMKVLWRTMGALRLVLGLAPENVWRLMLRQGGYPDSAATTWVAGELTRGSARDLAEAGRELSRFDGRPWLGDLDVPAAVIVTTKDSAVPPARQRELAELTGARTFDVAGTHVAVTEQPDAFNAALRKAIRAVAPRKPAAVAA